MASRSWNKVELIGNLTRDPELRYTPSGTAVATFSIATNRTYMSDGERKEEADFHRCVAWTKLAELCSQLLKKGNRVFVSGRLQNRSWEQDGQTKYMTEIVIEDMILLTSRNGTVETFTEDVEPSVPKIAPAPKAEPAPAPEPEPADAAEPHAKEPTPAEEKSKPDEEQKTITAKEDPGDLDDLPF